MKNQILETLIPFLNKENFFATVIQATKEIPIDQLFVKLHEDYKNRENHAELAFLPNIPGVSILQFYVPLPYKSNNSVTPDLARFMICLNGLMPLSGFGLQEPHNTIYFRYLLSCQNSEVDPKTVIDTLWMIDYLLSKFGKLVEDLANETITFTKAMDSLTEILENAISKAK